MKRTIAVMLFAVLGFLGLANSLGIQSFDEAGYAKAERPEATEQADG